MFDDPMLRDRYISYLKKELMILEGLKLLHIQKSEECQKGCKYIEEINVRISLIDEKLKQLKV